jgi:hypothetical protein
LLLDINEVAMAILSGCYVMYVCNMYVCTATYMYIIDSNERAGEVCVWV